MVRIIFVIPLGAAFFLALLIALVVLRLSGTILNPAFYPDQLEKADIYRFAMVDVLESALDEARYLSPEEIGVDSRDNPLVASGLSTFQLTGAVHDALSHEDLEELVAPPVLQFGEYMAGKSDEVDLTVDVAGHIRVLVDEVLALLRVSAAYDRLIERELEPRFRDAAGDILPANENPSGWLLYLFGTDEEAEDRLVRVVMSAVTSEWLAEQVERALPELTAYLVGDSDSFEIRVRLDDAQAAAAANETKAIIRESNLYDLVFTGVVEPEVEDALGEFVELPSGVEITKDEVVEALRQVASPAWVQEQAESIIDDVSAYTTGRSDDFSTSISLAQPKMEAAPLLQGMARAKLTEVLERLPTCSMTSDGPAARSNLGQTLPACFPPGVSVGEVLETAGPAITKSVQAFVLAPVPDTITFTETDVRSLLGESGGQGALEFLAELRELYIVGWTYNQDDLRTDLSGNRDALRILDETRSYLSNGYVHTYQDSSKGESDDPIGFALDSAREWSDVVRRYKWLAYLAAPALLVIIGFVGGTGWRSRFGWASAVLLPAAVTIAVLTWPVYETFSNNGFEYVRAEIFAQTDGPLVATSHLIVAKSIDVAEAAADDFIGGIRRCGLALAVIACAGLFVTAYWSRIADAAEPLLHKLVRRGA